MKRFLFAVAAIVMTLLCCDAASLDFDKLFSDSTLRLDYIFTGGPDGVRVGINRISRQSGWAGRRMRLDEVPLRGNGEITVATLEEDTIYRTPFSTLFHEWYAIGEKTDRAFENTFLVPMPRNKAKVTATIYNNRNEVMAQHSFIVDPEDILIREIGRNPLPHRYVYGCRDSADTKIDVAFLAEGYTADQMDQFYADAAEAVDALMSHEPFGSMRERFNFVAVASPSEDENVSVPYKGEWRNTAVSSNFSTFYSDRYLTSTHVFDVHDLLAGIPYEHIIILANTPSYGGGGIYNFYTLTSSRDKNFRPVVVHEFGHSFGGLGDEYFYKNDDAMNDTYPTDVEPWEPNITTLVDFDSKWKNMLVKGTPVPTPDDQMKKYPIGVYEGAAYSFKGIYRPVEDCRMHTNKAEQFCPVCQAALRAIIEFYTK